MELDKKALEGILSMNDRELQALIGALAAEAGVDMGSFAPGTGDISQIRRALTGIGEEDIARAARTLRGNQKP